MNNKCENEIDTAAEAVVEIVKTNSTIGIILAIGFAAGCVSAAILAIIYSVNWISEKKSIQPIYPPISIDNYRPN